MIFHLSGFHIDSKDLQNTTHGQIWPIFKIKLYCNIVKHICLYIVYVFFYVRKTELSSNNRDCMAHKA